MRFFNTFLFILIYLPILSVSANPHLPDLMLLETYQSQSLQGWVMSEKLDGIRAYWDGKTLFTRNGYQLTPPSDFLINFPPFSIDGELFSQRNEFDTISSIVREQSVVGWQKLKLYVFDVPDAKGDLFARLDLLKQYLQQHSTPYIEIIPQIPIQNSEQVYHFLQQVEQLKGEGVVLRNPKAPYERKRSSQILKLKTTLDEECTVIAHHEGKGQFQNHFGSLSCQNHRGIFRIGSGFNLNDRANPPAIGSIISYKYRGVTKTGKPRFATYWRVKTLEK